jgi:hypothetical protein
MLSRKERLYIEWLRQLSSPDQETKDIAWIEVSSLSPEYRKVLRSRIKKKIRQMEKELLAFHQVAWLVEKHGRG